MACKEDYWKELLEDSRNRKPLMCPKTNTRCDHLKLCLPWKYSDRITFRCTKYSENLNTPDGFTNLERDYFYCDVHSKNFGVCKMCSHYGDCMISTVMKEEHPYAESCELYEYKYEREIGRREYRRLCEYTKKEY